MLQGGLDMKFNVFSVWIVIFMLSFTKGEAIVESKYDVTIDTFGLGCVVIHT